MIKLTKLAAGLALATCALASTSAFAQLTTNAGFASQYYFRGILQKDSSAFAGVDYTQNGLYIGAWTADVGQGLEVDGYGGYSFTDEASGFGGKIGYTGYFYTGSFDDTYNELNLGLSYKMLGVEYNKGKHTPVLGGPKQDYSFYAATLTASNGLYGKYGRFGGDFVGNYFEFGYGFKILELDATVATIFNNKDLSYQVDSKGIKERGQAITLTLKKTF
jgi:hypothetical protein